MRRCPLPRLRAAARALALAGLLLLAAGGLRAQALAPATIDLLVTDAETGAPLAGASVRLDGMVVAQSDSNGHLWVHGVVPGRHVLSVALLGRQPVAPELELLAGQVLNLEVVLDPMAVELEPVAVEAQRSGPGMARRTELGGGRRMGRSELSRLGSVTLGELISRLLREHWGGRMRCEPRIVADGLVLAPGSLDALPVQDLEALELYSVASLPPEFGGTTTNQCVTVGVWTRHG
jgi:hypothetical protein